MKPAYFKGIQWTRVFVTGPLDPVHNKHKYYCQIRQTNVSFFSKGARVIVRHYQYENHLRKDQRWPYEHFGKLDKITGTTVLAVRGKDGDKFSMFELEKEKPPIRISAPCRYCPPLPLLWRVYDQCKRIDEPWRCPFRDSSFSDWSICPLLWRSYNLPKTLDWHGQLRQTPGPVWESWFKFHHAHGMYLASFLLGFWVR